MLRHKKTGLILRRHDQTESTLVCGRLNEQLLARDGLRLGSSGSEKWIYSRKTKTTGLIC